jgi:dTDP-4-amino-4,6-dideoxy-D-galactose acyltransferase
MNNFQILQWDSEFFGFKVAKITEGCISLDSFAETYLNMTNEGIKLIYWPASTDCKHQSELSEKFQGLLVDIKTTYSIELSNIDEIVTKTEVLKSKIPDKKIIEIAIQCGEYSRYKVDPGIPEEKFEELYKLWMIKSLNGEMADDVIVSKINDAVAGLITVYCKNNIGSIGLVGVHSNFRGKGIGGELIKASLSYFKKMNCTKASVVTQGKNEAACRLYETYGFKVQNQANFYHFWLK